MTDLTLVSALLIGVAGSVHCAGMCGGIVGAFSFILPKHQAAWPYMLAYNAGRISSYVLAGALAGGLGSIFSHQLDFAGGILKLLSGIFLLLVALYIGNWWRVLVRLEQLGNRVWKRISPLAKHFLPFSTPWQAFPYGMIWGWLPCGLVYSALTWSLAAGSVAKGALLMLFFGLGTLPALLALGHSGAALRQTLSRTKVRSLIALALLAYALILIYQALHNSRHIILGQTI